MSDCICEGNWRLLVSECKDLFDRRYKDMNGNLYVFFGLVYGQDDYYYGMAPVGGGRVMLLSCVGSLFSHGYELENRL